VSSPDFVESMADIFNVLAGKALEDYSKNIDKEKKKDEYAASIVHFLKKTDEYVRVNEYTWLIKGFFELKQGFLHLIKVVT
jgi:hypothetical protein